MKQENLDRLKALRQFAESAQSWWARYRKSISDPSCDKYEAQFNGDDRFVVFELKRLQFSALTGYFGSSACSTFSGGLNAALAQKYFPKALTLLAPQLFEKMAELASADADSLDGEARKELEALRILVDAAKDTHNATT